MNEFMSSGLDGVKGEDLSNVVLYDVGSHEREAFLC